MSKKLKTLSIALTALLACTATADAVEDVSTWLLPPVAPTSGVPDLTVPLHTAPEFTAPDSPVERVYPATEASTEIGLNQDAIDAEQAKVDVELETESTWYDWVIPSYWYQEYWHPSETWESSFELGVDGSEGNSNTLTFRSGVNLRRKVDWSDLQVAINYVKSTAQEAETKHNAQFDANHDWILKESRWSVFAKSILVYDEFRPFDLELTLNTGLGYQIIDTDVWSLKGRVGSGASRQWDGPDDSWRPEAMLGIDFEYAISSRQKLRVKSEFFPQWDDFQIYRVRTNAGWEMLLDEATNMSLKLGVIDRYDSQAGTAKPNALDYSLLLLWKL